MAPPLTKAKGPIRVPKFKTMKLADRKAAFSMLQGMRKNGSLPRGSFAKVAREFSVSRNTIGKLWWDVRVKVASNRFEDDPEGKDNELTNKEKDSDIMVDLNDDSLFKPNLDRRRAGKYKYDRDELKTSINELPIEDRGSYRKLEEKLKVSFGTLWRISKEEELIKRRTTKKG